MKRKPQHPGDPETGICSDCGQPAPGTWINIGIGPYEYWGSRETHTDWRWASKCCGAELLDERTYEDGEDDT